LIFSLLLVLGALCLVKILWYPGDIYKLISLEKIVLIIIVVDVCIGPLLTLVVSNPAKDKKELKNDLRLIVSLQLLVLLGGLYTLHAARPLFVVFAVDRFELVTKNHLPDNYQEQINISGIKTPRYGILWLYAELPTNEKEKNDLLFQSIKDGTDLAQSPRFYEELANGRDQIFLKLRPVSELVRLNKLDENGSKHLNELAESGYGYLPLKGEARDMSVLIKKGANKMEMEIIDLSPWSL